MFERDSPRTECVARDYAGEEGLAVRVRVRVRVRLGLGFRVRVRVRG